MSVVNKMLQDLEARKAVDKSVSADYQPPLKRNRWLWYAVILLIGAGMLVYWLYSSTPFPFAEPNNNEQALVNEVKSQNKVAKIMLVASNNALVTTDNKPAESGIAQVETPSQASLVTELPVANLPKEEQPSLPALSETSVTAHTVVNSGEQNPPTPEDVKPASFQMKDSSQASQTVSLKQQLNDALASNNNGLSIKLLGQLIEQEPENIEAIKKLAALLFANGNVVKATQYLQSHVERAPMRGDLRLMLARLYNQQNKPDSALTLLQEIQPAQYIEIDYLAYRANLAQQLADYEAAQQDYTMLTQVDGNNARWWLGLAITEEKLGANKIALVSYYKAQKLAQLDPAVTDFIKQRISVLAGGQ